MKNLFSILSACLLLISITNLKAQESINNAGGEATGSGGTLSYSIGQLVFTSKTNNNYSVTDGVQQAYNSSTTLPLVLLDFEAKVSTRKEVHLVWTTTQERNTDYFTVERSKNGTDWETLTKVAGAGNSRITLRYETLDKTPYMGKSYYRLKQTNYDNTYTYSEIETINIDAETIRIYPNPTSDIAILNVGDYAEQLLNYTLLDAQGKILLEENIHQATHNIHLQNFSDGTYIIQVRAGENIISSHQLIKNH